MPLGMVLYESGDSLAHVYFPTNSIVSLWHEKENDVSAEISVVGNEDLIGIARILDGEPTPNRAVVRTVGHAYRHSGPQLRQEFTRNGEIQLRYRVRP
jgi:hypothetical protein